MKEHIAELKKLQTIYSDLHSKMIDIDALAVKLTSQQEEIHSKLIEARALEEKTINKLEEILGKKLTQDDLFEIIKANE
jgi:hypothetical protein